MSHYVTVKIWEPINQISRTFRYDVPLASVLHTFRMGEIAGVGAGMTRDSEIDHVLFQVVLNDLDKGLELVMRVLEKAGVPRGSEIRFIRGEKEERVLFGGKEALAIYLDSANLPAKVYRTCSCQGLAILLDEALESVDGEIRGSWVGRSETAIYLYGSNAESLFALIHPILASYPLCQNARVVIRHGNPALYPRTVFLPFHGDPVTVRQVYWGRAQGSA